MQNSNLMTPQSATPTPISFWSKINWKSGLWLALAGAVGSQVAWFLGGLLLAPFFDFSLNSQMPWHQILLGQGLAFLLDGLGICAFILVVDNHTSLRGKWTRDLLPGAALFMVLGFAGGVVGNLCFWLIPARAICWGIAAAFMGAGIGLIRRDRVQAARAAFGGCIGGVLSGFIIDAMLSRSYTDNTFALYSWVGTIITGVFIGFFLRLIQDMMQDAWLMGVSTGPYEGKRYSLTKDLSVGNSELFDISLHRRSDTPLPTGAFSRQGKAWMWQGEAAEINGVSSTQAVLKSGDDIRLGNAVFRFYSTAAASREAAIPSTPQIPSAQPPTSPAPPEAPPRTPVSPATVRWVIANTNGQWLIEPGTPITMGRRPDNSFVLVEPEASGHHARLEVLNGALCLTDLNSTNGTMVNGHRILPAQPVLLREGDHLQIARTLFRVSKN